MSAATLVSVESYLRLTEKPNLEYRDGVLYPKAMPTKYLIPDVAVADDFPGPYPTEAVRLCCEILSPEDRLGTMLAKCEEYHSWGVPFCWVIDPVKRTAWEYHSGGEPIRAKSTLRAGDIAVGLDELFSPLDK